MILFKNRKLLFECNPDILGEICSFLSRPWIIDAVNKAVFETRKSCAQYSFTLRWTSSDPADIERGQSMMFKLCRRTNYPSQLTVNILDTMEFLKGVISPCGKLNLFVQDIPVALAYIRESPDVNASIATLVNTRNIFDYERILMTWNVSQLAEHGPSQRWLEEASSRARFYMQRAPEIRIDCLGHSVKILRLGFTRLGDIEPIRNMRNLTVLELSGTLVADITALSGLSTLKGLYLRFLPITDLRAIQHLRRLVVLDVFATKITEISQLKGLKALRDLDISHTRVDDISVLPSLPCIEKLFAYETAIQSINCLLNCPNLKILMVTSHGANLCLIPFANSRTLQFFKTSRSSIRSYDFLEVMWARNPQEHKYPIYVEADHDIITRNRLLKELSAGLLVEQL